MLEQSLHQIAGSFVLGWLVGGTTCTLITLAVLHSKLGKKQ